MYEDITPESIRQEILAYLGAEVDKREGGFASDMAAPVALELWKLYDSLNAVLPIAFVDESSGEYIDKRCGDYGIVRKAGTRATVTLTFTGEAGAVIPAGAVCVTDSGLEFETLERAVISAGGVSVESQAASVGEAYNVGPGEISRQRKAISGVTAVTNAGAAAGGGDPESDAALVERLYAYLRRPATSGNADHYRQWALEVEGVGDAKVKPLWNGAGTVKVLIVGPGKEPVAETVRQACADHIEESRPIGAEVTVVSAEALPVSVSAAVVLDNTLPLAEVKASFTAALGEYLKSVAFEKYTLLYNRIAFLLLDTAGVENYTSLTVNGGGGDIEIGEGQVPSLGEVSLSE